MKLRLIAETEEPFFAYQPIANDMWNEKVHEAQKKFDISFSTENDDDIGQREIKIDQDHWDHTTCKFKCELRAAGGDWQNPLYYFRCQIVDGYADKLSVYSDPYFCFIPGVKEGNPHLAKTKNGWSAPDHDSGKDDELEPNERECWASLKKYLEKLVNDEIQNVKSGKY